MTIGQLRIGDSELWWLREGVGSHGDTPLDPSSVVESLRGAFVFAEEAAGTPGLRPPQLGALHAILANRSTENTDASTVVMPTGTGKTATMLTAYCHSPMATLVMVPSDTLRTQIASSFATLGKLPQVGAGGFHCPAVLVLKGVNRPGMSGDSISWEGWSHVRWFVEEVPAGAA